MEPISEERQRKIITWLHPDLSNKDFGLCNGDGAMPRRASWYGNRDASWMGGRISSSKELEPLYVWGKDRNWQPNYQFFFAEIVPRLEAKECLIGFTNCSVNSTLRHKWVLSPEYKDPYSSTDPIAATAEYVEALEVGND